MDSEELSHLPKRVSRVERKNAVAILYSLDMGGEMPDEWNRIVDVYITAKDCVDRVIDTLTREMSAELLSPLDRAIVKVLVTEAIFFPTDFPVVVDEMIRIAKEISTTHLYKWLNVFARFLWRMIKKAQKR